MTENSLFIIALTNHPNFGPLLTPYFAKVISPDIIEIEEQATFTSEERMPDIEKKILSIARSYSDKELMIAFSKEQRVADFLRGVTEQAWKEVIRPFIDRKLREILILVRVCGMRLYAKDAGVKRLYEHNRIWVFQEDAVPDFLFERKDKSFRYSLKACLNGTEVSLQRKPVVLLSASPAIWVQGNELLAFKKLHATRLLPFLDKPYVEVPLTQAKVYLEKIVFPLMVDYPVRLAGIEMHKEERACQAELSVERGDGDQVVLQLRFRYGNRCFYAGQLADRIYPHLEEVDGELAVYTFTRDSAKERKAVEGLKKWGFSPLTDGQFVRIETSSGYALINWLWQHREEWSAYFDWVETGASGQYFLGEVCLKQDISDAPDWFEIRMTVQIGEYCYPFVAFRKQILEGRREFRLPDGRMVVLPDEWFDKYTGLLEFGEEQKGGSIRIRKIYAGMIADLEPEGEPLFSKAYVRKKQLPVPPGIRVQLREYQQEGFSWLVHLAANRMGACLADDMGLGKTLQTIAFLQYLYEPGPITTEDTYASVSEESGRSASLLVVPTSLRSNWKREIDRFSTLRVYEYSGEQKEDELYKRLNRYPVVLITYGLLRRDIDLLERYPFRVVILDESQNIKNPDSVTYHAVVRLKSEMRIALTGTPIENSLRDLWAQFNFINPGLLGLAADFKRRFIIPIIKEENRQVQHRLQQLIQPFFLRRTKQQVAPELPPLTEKVIYCEMSAEQKGIYQKEKNLLRNLLLEEWHRNRIVALNGITRLRQLANHPGMVMTGYAGGSGKMEQVLEAYETLTSEGHKVLMFSSFVTHLEILAKAFDERGWRYAWLTGSTLDRDREISHFAAEPDRSAFFISLKAGGVGLNLTEADYVFILDPWWNPAAEMQAESRAHRMGQDKQVFVYRFISADTIEEKIRILQEKKSRLAGDFITENDPLQQLTDEEWRELL